MRGIHDNKHVRRHTGQYQTKCEVIWGDGDGDWILPHYITIFNSQRASRNELSHSLQNLGKWLTNVQQHPEQRREKLDSNCADGSLQSNCPDWCTGSSGRHNSVHLCSDTRREGASVMEHASRATRIAQGLCNGKGPPGWRWQTHLSSLCLWWHPSSLYIEVRGSTQCRSTPPPAEALNPLTTDQQTVLIEWSRLSRWAIVFPCIQN